MNSYTVVSSIQKEFNSYRISYHSNNPAVVTRMTANVPLLYNKQVLGVLRFVDVSPLPKNVLDPVTEDFDVFYHLDRFNDIINILRYEKPLWIAIDDNLNAQIVSHIEPIGEQEP
jgi:hypothetical protein